MKHRLVHLDCLRGVAALLVCLEHLRAFLFVPFAQIKSPNLPERAFYFVTGLGHQAVMIFFVLSGFLVGGSVISAHQNGKWSWTNYALRRMSRLWMVLIPALLLTLLWDSLGQHQSHDGYRGEFRSLYNSGPTLDAPADLRPVTFLGNGLFLQTISVNCYGTNGPLWSLANEFWYYLLFPLLLGIFTVSGFRFQVSGFRPPPSVLRPPSSGIFNRLICAAVALATLMLLPRGILQGGLIWLFGAAVFALLQNEYARRWARHPLWLLGSAMLTLMCLAASRLEKLGSGDSYLLGASVSCLVAALAVRSVPPPVLRSQAKEDSTSDHRRLTSVLRPLSSRLYAIYARLSAGLSEFSYTLYLVHFPILAFLFYSVFKGHQLPSGLHSAGWFAALLMAVLLYAAAVYWCFERNTDRLRKKLESLLPGKPAIVCSPVV